MSPKVLCCLPLFLCRIYSLSPSVSVKVYQKNRPQLRGTNVKQRIGFRVYGVVEKPNRIVKFRGSEQQETMSVLRTEGPKGRVHVFKTALLLAWGLSGGSWSQRRCCCCCSCNSRQEKGKRGTLRSPCSTLPSPTAASHRSLPGSDSPGAG